MPTRFDKPPGRLRQLLHILCAAALVLVSGCNLPGLPGEDAGADIGVPDVQPEDVGEGDVGERVCEPGSRECHVTGVLVCSEDGTDFTIESCSSDQVCQAGRCTDLENRCESSLPYSVSATRLLFDSGPMLRGDSAQVTLENCSDREISLWDTSLRGPERPGGATSWSLENADTFRRLLLAPGQSVDLSVKYTPEYGFFREPGTLELNIRAGDSRSFPTPIQLSPRIDCVTAPPRIEFGEVEVGEPIRVSMALANCGTETQTVTLPGAEVLSGSPGWKIYYAGSESGASDDATGGDGDLSVQLEPESTDEEVLVIEATEPGRLNLPVVVRARRTGSSGRPRRVVSHLVGRAVQAPCTEIEPRVPQARVGERPWAVRSKLHAEPFEEVALRPADGKPIDVQLTDRPVGSHATLAATPLSRGEGGEQPDKEASGWRLQPDVVGSYELTVRSLDDARRVGCRSETVELEVRPQDRLYVELRWQTEGDPFVADRGYGGGMDLNLHVLPHPSDTSSVQGWEDPAADCFQAGLRGGRTCSRAGGRVVGLSATGAGPEVLAFEQTHARGFAIAVHAWNPYAFSGARARLRLFADGEAVFEEPLEGRFGTTPGTVWWVGTWVPGLGEFLEVDRYLKDFP